ncbi:MAG TPA: DNA replication and repair protein RecF [Candidatus Saccharimonadales bacterium]|nr:DNA replication and repair protein RecF [Candidatus Saccharimonadales bacterium]
MVFTDIRLQNYRSYKDSSFELDGGVSIVVGPNGAGKSNLIESLLLVSNGTSYRGKNDLIKHGQEWARIDVHTKNAARSAKLNRKNKDRPDIEFIVGDKPYKRLPYSQRQPAVLFEPNNLLLFHGEPQARRDYLDTFSSQTNESYTTTLSRYKRALAQRNALLKNPHIDNSQLFVWNIRLCELAENIVKQRKASLDSIKTRLSEVYSKISGKESTIKTNYETRLNPDSYSASLLKLLEADFENDRARGFTGSGPHREDFSVTINDRSASTAASRGEIRTLLLTLKIIELGLLEDRTKNKPLLLLDDVFSELDNSRRKALTRFLKDYQTVITTTDADIILKNFSQDCQIIPLD